LNFSWIAVSQTLSVASGGFSVLIAIGYALAGKDVPRPSVLSLAFISVAAAWWFAYQERELRLKIEKKPRPSLKVVGYNIIERDWRIMKNSGQVDSHSKSGTAFGLDLWIENAPSKNEFGAIAESVAAQVTFSKDGKQLFVADGWWPERITDKEEDSIRFLKQKDVGIGAREYLEIAFKFYYASSAYGVNDGSRSCHEWCNPQLELREGSYSASVQLRGPNVNETVVVTFTNEGRSSMLHLDSPIFTNLKAS
jgi:hypothetical protein